jgi:hypothetical protein
MLYEIYRWLKLFRPIRSWTVNILKFALGGFIGGLLYMTFIYMSEGVLKTYILAGAIASSAELLVAALIIALLDRVYAKKQADKEEEFDKNTLFIIDVMLKSREGNFDIERLKPGLAKVSEYLLNNGYDDISRRVTIFLIGIYRCDNMDIFVTLTWLRLVLERQSEINRLKLK